jgi:hypothetical protein
MKRTALSVFFAGLAILGLAAADNQVVQAGPGKVISFDVAMDAQKWRMKSGEHPFFSHRPETVGAGLRLHTPKVFIRSQ